jgi:hypothetical protein
MFLTLQQYQPKWHPRNECIFYELLALNYMFQSTDPRDKIYDLPGLDGSLDHGHELPATPDQKQEHGAFVITTTSHHPDAPPYLKALRRATLSS